MIRRPPRSPLFPYPPLFRSNRAPHFARGAIALHQEFSTPPRRLSPVPSRSALTHSARSWSAPELPSKTPESRSEEHTSELQSQSNLVCRLLLEKKKDTAT